MLLRGELEPTCGAKVPGVNYSVLLRWIPVLHARLVDLKAYLSALARIDDATSTRIVLGKLASGDILMSVMLGVLERREI